MPSFALFLAPFAFGIAIVLFGSLRQDVSDQAGDDVPRGLRRGEVSVVQVDNAGEE